MERKARWKKAEMREVVRKERKREVGLNGRNSICERVREGRREKERRTDDGRTELQ